MKRIPLSEKMILYFLILGIGSIILTGYFSFYSARRALLSRTFEQLISLRIARKSAVEGFFKDRIHEITQKASVIAELNYLPDQIEVRTFMHPDNGYYTGACLADKNGNLITGDSASKKIANPGNYRLPAEILETSTARVIDYTLSPEGLSQELLLIAPIKIKRGAESYFLVWLIDSEAIDNLLLGRDTEIGFGTSGETYLVGSDRLMRSQSRFISDSRLQTKAATFSVDETYNYGESRVISGDYRGIKVLSSGSRIFVDELDWIILSEIDYKEVVAPVGSIRNSIMLLTVMAAVVFFIITYLISLKITAPLVKLTHAATDLGDGVQHELIEITSNDEIGDLTEAFNKMSIKLREKEDALRTEKYNRLRSTIDGQDIERQRLSRELHDGIGQSLIAVRLQLGAMEGSSCLKEEEKLKSVINLTDSVIDEVRAISNDLMPPSLLEFGLSAAVKQLCNTIHDSTGINIDITGELPGDRLSRKPRLYVFRIIQEILSNATRHSGADQINIIAETENETLRIDIADNGCGFDLNSPCTGAGHGLNNIKERADLIKATLDIITENEAGTRFILKVPLNKSNHDKSNPC